MGVIIDSCGVGLWIALQWSSRVERKALCSKIWGPSEHSTPAAWWDKIIVYVGGVLFLKDIMDNYKGIKIFYIFLNIYYCALFNKCLRFLSHVSGAHCSADCQISLTLIIKQLHQM